MRGRIQLYNIHAHWCLFLFSAICFAFIFLSGCNSSKPKPPAFTAKPTAGKLFKFHEVPEKFHGLWEGTLPCADCPEISFSLNLHPNYTFTSSAVKKDVITKPIEISGVYMMRSDSMITLVHQGLEIHQIALKEERLLLLNNEAKPLTPELNESYFLSKAPQQFSFADTKSGNNRMLPQESSWKLLSLNGYTIKGNYVLGQDPTLSLNFLTKGGKGYAGCNSFGFRFISEYNFLTIGYIVVQNNTCFTGYVEDDYLYYLHQSPFQYEIYEDKLLLRSSTGYILEFIAIKGQK